MARFGILLLLLLQLVLPTWAQGGSMAGGFGAVSGRTKGDGDVTTATNILTPGQHSEWALTIKDNETIIAQATTTNFDPAIQLVDAVGKVLAENDDIRTGEQDALLTYRFAKGGSYKLLVKAFKGAGGGQFRLTLRRFVATPTAVGERTVCPPAALAHQAYRFRVDTDQTLLLNLQGKAEPSVDLFDTLGQRVHLRDQGNRSGRRLSFTTAKKGDYYLRFEDTGERGKDYAFTLVAARTFTFKPNDTAPAQTLPAGGLDLWRFEGKAGSFLRIGAVAPGVKVQLELERVGAKGDEDSSPADDKEKEPVVLDTFRSGEQVALLVQDGTYAVRVTQALGLEARYTLTSSTELRTWATTEPLVGTLPLGKSEYVAIEGKAGEILQLEGESTQFALRLQLLGTESEEVIPAEGGALTVLLKKSGRYLLGVSAPSHGGSGAYRVQRKPNPVRPLAFGTRTEGTLGEGASAIWSFTGKAGQAILLSVRSSDFDTAVVVFGPDGIQVAANDDGGEGTNSLLSVKLPLEGTYTIWVSGSSGAGKYTIRLLDAE